MVYRTTGSHVRNGGFQHTIPDKNEGNDSYFAAVAVAVKGISLPQFRAMLVENFNILFHEQKVVWPKRLASKSRPRHVPRSVIL